MSKPFMASLNECPIGEVVHEKHTWRQGFFLHKYECDGVSQKFYDMLQIMKAGSAGTLTQEQSQTYRAKYGRD